MAVSTTKTEDIMASSSLQIRVVPIIDYKPNSFIQILENSIYIMTLDTLNIFSLKNSSKETFSFPGFSLFKIAIGHTRALATDKGILFNTDELLETKESTYINLL